MKKLSYYIFLMFFQPLFGQEGTGAWELEKDEDGIKVYTRIQQGQDFKEFKGIMTLENSSLEMVSALLVDIENYDKFFPRCESPKILKSKGETYDVHYIISLAPWPATNRDGVYEQEVTYDKVKKTVYFKLRALPDYIPRKDEYVRIPKADILWTVQYLGPKKTKVTYQAQIDPGGKIPTWLANLTSVEQPFQSLNNIRNGLNNGLYDNATVSFISE